MTNDCLEAKGAKEGINLQSASDRRVTARVSLREKNRDGTIKKARLNDRQDLIIPVTDQHTDIFSYSIHTPAKDIPIELLPKFVELVHSSDLSYMLQGVIMIRKLLCVQNNPPIDLIIATGVPVRLVELLGINEPKIQFEATWALTNIGSGQSSYTRYIISIGTAPALIPLLSSSDENCREQATWALGNIAGDTINSRDYIIGLNVIPLILNVISLQSDNITIIRNSIWTLTNMVRGRPVPSYDIVGNLVQFFATTLYSSDLEQVLDSLWGLAFLVDGGKIFIDAINTTQSIPRIYEILNLNLSVYIPPAIRIIGGMMAIITGFEQTLINTGFIPIIRSYLDHDKPAIKKDALWAFSNMFCGSNYALQVCINNHIVPKIIDLMEAKVINIKHESTWAMCNFTSHATPEQISYCLEHYFLEKLLSSMRFEQDVKLIRIKMEAIDNILQAGVIISQQQLLSSNIYLDKLIECDGYQILLSYTQNVDDNVSSDAVELIKYYFPDDNNIDN